MVLPLGSALKFATLSTEFSKQNRALWKNWGSSWEWLIILNKYKITSWSELEMSTASLWFQADWEMLNAVSTLIFSGSLSIFSSCKIRWCIQQFLLFSTVPKVNVVLLLYYSTGDFRDAKLVGFLASHDLFFNKPFSQMILSGCVNKPIKLTVSTQPPRIICK